MTGHLVSVEQMMLPIGTPVITACGEVRPQTEPKPDADVCPKCTANVIAINGLINGKEPR